MRRFPFAAVGASAFGIAVLILACSSVPDVTFSDDASASGSSGASSGASSGGSSGIPTDGPKDVLTDCKATGPEDCFDGIDNDCNGHTDCDDSACTAGSQCIDPAPAGWTLIAFNPSGTAMCGTGYDTPTDLKAVNGTGSGMCGCDCNVTMGTSCAAGTWAVNVDTGSCTTAYVNPTTNANCTILNGAGTIANTSAVASVTPPSGPTECTGTTNIMASPVTTGFSCNVATGTKFGKCTNAAQQCAPRPTAGSGVCVTKLGVNTCPAPYTKLSTAGTAATDNRTCNTCSCEPKGCSGTIELFDQPDCTLGGNKKTTGTIDNTCSTVTDKNFTPIRYKTTTTGPANGCGFATAFNTALVNSITWTEQRTVCCKP